MSAQTRTEIASLLDRHGVRPVRRLGQHFLADANLTRRIVREAEVGPGQRVVEVGAGTGTLTRALVASGASVLAYEVDRRLQPLLKEVTEGLEVELRFADVAKVDLAEELGEGPWVLVANLPYNIGTPLVMEVLRGVPAVSRLVVMVQQEVGERLVATSGDAAYGLPSVVTALYGRAKVAFGVPAQVFYPQPQVSSVVLTIDRREPDPMAAEAVEIARAGFGQRRKMLRSSLRRLWDDPLPIILSAGLDPTGRAEELGPDDFLRLARSADGHL